MKKNNNAGFMILLVVLVCIFKYIFNSFTGNNIVLSTTLVFITIFIVLLLRIIYITRKEIRERFKLFDEGKYEEIIANSLDKLNRSNNHNIKQNYLITIANCYARMGNFQESMNYLEKADETKMKKYTKVFYFSLQAFNLYYLNQNLDKALELIKKSRDLLDVPSSILLNALIEQELNSSGNAEKFINQYFDQTSRKKCTFSSGTLIYTDDFISNVSEKFMLGLYYMKIGEEEKSKNYFSFAADFKYQNYFSDRAKELCT